MNYLNQKEWNENSSSVWKEIVSRFGKAAYDDEATRATHQATLKIEYDNNQYQRDRKQAYPSIGDQADMAYWDRKNGTTTLDDAITAVKEAHPKPA
jgi:hypothetical protein